MVIIIYLLGNQRAQVISSRNGALGKMGPNWADQNLQISSSLLAFASHVGLVVPFSGHIFFHLMFRMSCTMEPKTKNDFFEVSFSLYCVLCVNFSIYLLSPFTNIIYFNSNTLFRLSS